MFSLTARNWTTSANATEGNPKRREKALYGQSQAVWSTRLPWTHLWFTCNKAIGFLSHLPCYWAWWSSMALPFGLSASFSFISFPYLASPCFHLWISLSLSCLTVALHPRKQFQSKGADGWLRFVPMQAWCKTEAKKRNPTCWLSWREICVAALFWWCCFFPCFLIILKHVASSCVKFANCEASQVA